jgi:hypothetical protein
VDNSLSIDFPGIGFAATVVGNVLTARIGNGLSPFPEGALGVGESATLAFAARVNGPDHRVDQIANSIELVDQFVAYAIPPAVIPLESTNIVFLPPVLR